MTGFEMHLPTLLITGSVASLCAAFVLSLAWRSDRRTIYLVIWSTAYLATSASFLLIALRGMVGDFLSIQIAHTALVLAFALLWLGFRHFLGQRRRRNLMLAAAGPAAMLVFLSATPLGETLGQRAIVISVLHLCYLLAIPVDLLRLRKREALPAVDITVVVYSVQCAVQSAHLVYALVGQLEYADNAIFNSRYVALQLFEWTLFGFLSALLQLVLVGQRSERRLRSVADTDELTGLANRRAFMRHIGLHLPARSRGGALLLMDLDHFKQINDGYGHLAGDRALIAFADVLRDGLPPPAIVARIGGEEFAAYLPDTDATKALAVAEELCAATRLMRTRGTTSIRLTVSIGIAPVTPPGHRYEALYRAADGALYRAKTAGRDRVVVHAEPLSQMAGAV